MLQYIDYKYRQQTGEKTEVTFVTKEQCEELNQIHNVSDEHPANWKFILTNNLNSCVMEWHILWITIIVIIVNVYRYYHNGDGGYNNFNEDTDKNIKEIPKSAQLFLYSPSR